jgi:hypothetical protein
MAPQLVGTVLFPAGSVSHLAETRCGAYDFLSTHSKETHA